ncbi:hypothetical protein ASE40_18430 [Flavobacterium sp. Root935]|nr:hypothetical protein ASE40_18430 [Flavobacterium sp. Root935]
MSYFDIKKTSRGSFKKSLIRITILSFTNKKQKVKSVTFSSRFAFLHFYKYVIFAKNLNV